MPTTCFLIACPSRAFGSDPVICHLTFGRLAGSRPKICVWYSLMISGRRRVCHVFASRTGVPSANLRGSGSV